jgi:DNA-binding NtrC family response regulator
MYSGNHQRLDSQFRHHLARVYDTRTVEQNAAAIDAAKPCQRIRIASHAGDGSDAARRSSLSSGAAWDACRRGYHRSVNGLENSTRSEVKRLHRDSSAHSHAWLFHVFSCETPKGASAAALRLDDVDAVVLGRGAAGAATPIDGDRRQLALGFADQWMSTRHARIERCIGGFWLSDEHSKNGVLLNGNRVDGALLVDGDWIEAGHTILRYRCGALPPPRHPRKMRSDATVALPTALPTLEEQSDNLEEIARSSLSVVLQGETGTGKEVLARAVHRLSGRRGELIAINCGALPATLLESELFGYRKGSFSNAIEDRIGLVRAADMGTLFLDEIGDLPQASQTVLLRVLQEREVTPLGGTRPIKVDLRVICATHRDLETQVALGQFRADLYARLSGHRFVIPPLRERREDLGLLTAALLRRIAPGHDVRFEPGAARALCRYGWPLNVRELETCLVSALVLARGGAIGVEHLSAAVVAAGVEDSSCAVVSPPRGVCAAKPASPIDGELVTERRQISDALARCGGNQSRAAKLLGISRNTLIARIERFGLARPLMPRR